MANNTEMTEKEKAAKLFEKYKNNLPELLNVMKILQVPGKSATISSLEFLQAIKEAIEDAVSMKLNYNSQVLALTEALTRVDHPSKSSKNRIQIQGLTAEQKKMITTAIDQLAREYTSPSAALHRNSIFRKDRVQQDASRPVHTHKKGPGR